jgi:molecular chaperone GrpE (heat shock protein)
VHVIRRFLSLVRQAPPDGSITAMSISIDPAPATPNAAPPVVIPDRPLPPVSDSVPRSAVDARLEGLQTALGVLRDELRTGLAHADRSRDIIVRLEAENRALKTRESERKQEPLIKGVISLFDDLRSVTRAHAQPAAGGAEVPLLSSLQVFEQQALELLRRSDVEPFEPHLADRFDASRQEAWEAITTNSPAEDMHIAEVIRLGFEFGGRIIRPAAVKVYRCQAAITLGASS